MSSKPKLYVDSCCFIEALKHRRGLPLSTPDPVKLAIRDEDCWYFRRLCDAARDGSIQLVTSMLSIAECTHLNEAGGPSKETRDLIVEFLSSGAVVDLVEPDLFVSERARDLLWNDGILLSGADSLHVATALLEECREFLTLDRKIKTTQKLAAAMPALLNLHLSVIRPSKTLFLPAEYRSDDLFGQGKGQP
jgi:hypothetical protein